MTNQICTCTNFQFSKLIFSKTPGIPLILFHYNYIVKEFLYYIFYLFLNNELYFFLLYYDFKKILHLYVNK